jgi:hypothetical protein
VVRYVWGRPGIRSRLLTILVAGSLRTRGARPCLQESCAEILDKVGHKSIFVSKVGCVGLAGEGPGTPVPIAGPAQGIGYRLNCLELPTLALRVWNSTGNVHDTGGEWRCLRSESADR